MEKILDIEALSKMPITDEFAQLLFGDKCNKDNVVLINRGAILTYTHTPCLYEFKIYNDGRIEWSSWGETDGVSNAFQIVRYIDNYLNENKKINGDLVLYLATNSEPTKENLINGIESVPFAYVVSEDRFVPINKKDMDKKVTDFEFLTRGEVLPI